MGPAFYDSSAGDEMQAIGPRMLESLISCDSRGAKNTEDVPCLV